MKKYYLAILILVYSILSFNFSYADDGYKLWLKYNLNVNTNFLNEVVETSITDTTFQLYPMDANTRYYWRVNASNIGGTSFSYDDVNFTTGDQITDVEKNKPLSIEFNLAQNYPNPFNPITTISFSLPQSSSVHLVLFNVLGKEVRNIAHGLYSASKHSIKLNAEDLSSGIYFYRLEAGSFVSTRKLILMK